MQKINKEQLDAIVVQLQLTHAGHLAGFGITAKEAFQHSRAMVEQFIKNCVMRGLIEKSVADAKLNKLKELYGE